MKKVSSEKMTRIKKISDEDNIISALAIDQRGSLRKMFNKERNIENMHSVIEQFKIFISEELTPFSSSILLDPEYGLPASEKRGKNSGLLLAYERSGYDPTEIGRLPKILTEWSVKRLKEAGGDAVKFLLYYDIDESEEINEQKQAFIERIGSECEGEDVPFFLEIVSYDADINDSKSEEYAKMKPHKVIGAMKEFSKDRYDVDVLKVEVPVNMNFVEGYTDDKAIHTKKEASHFFKEQNEATSLPYIYLSGGVSAKLFQETLKFASESGAEFNGVLCGRATWKNSVPEYINGGDSAIRNWLASQGKENIQELGQVVKETAVSWDGKLERKN